MKNNKKKTKQISKKNEPKKKFFWVRPSGIEPTACWSKSKCTSNWARTHWKMNGEKKRVWKEKKKTKTTWKQEVVGTKKLKKTMLFIWLFSPIRYNYAIESSIAGCLYDSHLWCVQSWVRFLQTLCWSHVFLMLLFLLYYLVIAF